MSSNQAPLSAVLITRDAEHHLDAVLKGLGWAAEILVLDSGSTDDTLGIARRHGARIEHHPFDGYGPQKRRAVAMARHDWILALDADEVLDGEALAAVRSLPLAELDPRHCWRIRRRPFVGGREVRHGHWVPDRLVRLFNRRYHDYSDDPLHAVVRPSGRVHDLAGSLLHYSYRDMADIFRMDYHRTKAAEYRRSGRRAGGFLLALRASAVFCRSYVLRLGFLDGRLGVVVAMAGALNAVLGLAMASEGADREVKR